MYFNRISSGTILALLALSGMLVVVPFAAPAHALNSQLPTIQRDYTYVCGGGSECDFNFNITNPANNQFALTAFVITAPAGWSISFCDWYTSSYFDSCTSGSGTAEWTQGSSGQGLPPGATQNLEIGVNYPTLSSYPTTGTFTTTVQDLSISTFYAGPNIQLIDADPAGFTDNGGYVAVSGISATYTAGSGSVSVTAQLKDSSNNNVANGGIPVFFTQATAAHYGTFSGSGITCLRAQQCWGFTDSTGKVKATFQPQNIAGSYSFTAVAGGGYFGDGSYCNPPDCNYYYSDSGSIGYTTIPGAPTSVGYQLSSAAFPSIDWLPNMGTTTNMDASSNTFTGAQLLIGSTPIDISATDKFGNAETFAAAPGSGVISFSGSQNIQIQTASGGIFDNPLLPSTITCGVTAGFTCPTSGTSFAEPFDYYQGGNYGTAGVMTTTITATYGGVTFSVSGSSGAIETSTFATSGTITKTDHSTTLPVQSITAGKSVTFDVVLGVAQKGVPVTVVICQNSVCSDTTTGYSGTFTVASGVTNSTGVFSTSLNVDTKAGHVAEINATVLAPINGAPKNSFWIGPSNDITTQSGSAAKFTVVVGTGPVNGPAPITNAYPGETVYVNVVTSDTYGNPVSTVGIQQVQIALAANPATLSASSVYIPTNCYETNGTDGNGCTGATSFGAIAWTLPTTVGGSATIAGSGVLNGVSTTSATVTVNIVSKTPTLSVFSPKPLNNVIYSDSANVQFRGWANASLGYNGAATMTTLSWKIGSGSWSSTGLAGVTSQWSVIATLPSGLSTVVFNATDSKGNTVVSSTFSVLVDTAAPTITNVTPAGAVLTPGQLFQATIVDPMGDLNATSVQVWYNGTALTSSAVTVSGTNNPGSSVTYTVTASLPTSVGSPGHWSVAVTASDLAGNSATGANDLISVTVAFGNSITFDTAGATYGSVGAYKGVTVTVTNQWSTSQTIVVFATLKSGTNIYVAQGTVTVAAGGSATVFCADLQVVPAGTYTVTFSAVTTSNAAVSAPTTPITVTAT